MEQFRATARPRVGLLGNPSDLYGGYGLGFVFDAFRAEVDLAPAKGDRPRHPLLRAAWDIFCREEAALPPVRAHFRSTIPRQVGLAGSSAVIIAALRAMAALAGRSLTPWRLAELAWRAENELLRIRAGPLDRLVQAWEAFLAMDFADPFTPAASELLDPALLPPLLLAWDPVPGRSSGDVHAAAWERHRRGDRETGEVMAAIAGLARRGRAALEAGDHAAFRAAMDRNFDLRVRVLPIAPGDRQVVEAARAAGAAAKLCGSGGAVVVAPAEPDQVAALRSRLEETGYRTALLEPFGPA